MRALVLGLAGTLAALAPAHAQTLDLYSEFLRVDPFGEVVRADRAPQPREILSPAVVRGGYASYLGVVRAPRANYFVYIGVNPAEAVRASLYRVDFARVGGEWIPDALRPTAEPNFSVIPDPDAGIAGQTARVYLLDVWVPPTAAPGRIRVELQMKAGFWNICPLEMRILSAKAPVHGRCSRSLPAPDRPSAESALGPIEDFLEDPARRSGAPPRSAPLTLREVIRRNAEQDLSLAPAELVPAIRERLRARAGAGGEWYLGIRDLILRRAAER